MENSLQQIVMHGIRKDSSSVGKLVVRSNLFLSAGDF